MCFVRFSLLTLIVRMLERSSLLSPENVETFIWKVKEDTNVADSAEDAQQLSRRCTQDVDCEVCKSWAAVYQSIARRMLSYLDNSEASKVGAKELEEHVLAPDEPSVNLEHIASRAKGEKRRKCSRSSADREEKRS